MDGLFFVGGSAVFGIIVIVAFGIMLAKLYQRATKEVAFVRTGAGGAKVIKDGGALVLPILHGITQVNMNTIKLDVVRKEKDALITYDRMRVDVGVEFFVRVAQNEEAIARAAETLGTKTMNPTELRQLVEGKFVDALRSVAAAMTMKDLHEKRSDFVNSVQKAVASDLEKNGLELESVSLTSFDQTNKNFFNPDNAFDAEGLTLLTQEIEQRKKMRNDIERETELQIAQKNLATEREQLQVRQEQATVQIETEKQIAFKRSAQEAEVAKFTSERTREAEQARIDAEKQTKASQIEAEQAVEQRQIEKNRALREANIEQEKRINIAEQDKQIVLAKKSEEQAAAQASAEFARANQVKANQEVQTIEAVAEAQRRQQIEVINAETQAQKDSVKVVVIAEAEAKAADMRAEAVRKVAKAESDAEVLRAEGIKAKYDAEAEGQSKLNEAANKQDPEVIAMQVKMKLIEKLPEIIRESVKPMENIESIRIVDVGGLNNLGTGNGDGSNGGQSKSLPDQVVDASLRHQAAKPLINNLLEAVGIQDADIAKAIQQTMK